MDARLSAKRAHLLGIVNLTPDSFSDGGVAWGRGVEAALALLEEGAEGVDLGGESTRPGSLPVPEEEELRRVLPVVRDLRRQAPRALISVDTNKGAVARAALDLGADWINDVRAGEDPELLRAVAGAGATVVLMHARERPLTMQHHTHYSDLPAEVLAFLADRVERAEAVGVPRDRILVDPGLGFAKRPMDNLQLFPLVPALAPLAGGVLIGASRKRFVGELSGEADPAQRVAGSIGAALAAARWGADWLRIHDVRATRQALQVFQACGGLS